MEAHLQSFLISALYGVQWSTLCPTHYTLVGKIRVPTEQSQAESFEKNTNFLHLSACEPWTVQPLAQQQYKKSKTGWELRWDQTYTENAGRPNTLKWEEFCLTSHDVWIRHNTDDRILRHDTRLETITDLCEIMRWCLLRPEIFNETWVGYHHLRRILLGACNFNLQKVFKDNLKFNTILLAFY